MTKNNLLSPSRSLQRKTSHRYTADKRLDVLDELQPATFDLTSGHQCDRDSSGSEYSRSSYGEIPIKGPCLDITSIDDVIRRNGGMTTSLERLPGQMKKFKGISPPHYHELVESKREIGRLRAEIAYYQDVQRALMSLFSKSIELSKMHHEAVRISSQGLAIAEHDFLQLWNIPISLNTENKPENIFKQSPAF
ncbi:hypothetical protein FQN57_003539 [Myotisia sp. PD_48]|nr:hypothetical protein FQN57_003539 [Myotisia sp. PD_48]